jgi:polyprenyl P-hydroxybenzoate/phenylacrylic acid decarboxylase-like protein
MLKALHSHPDIETHVVISRGADTTIHLEMGAARADFENLADVCYEPEDLGAAISSGSFHTIGMAVVPCSMKTLAAIAAGTSTDLLTRAADVCLKERRRLVLVTRETPLSLIDIRNMETVTLAVAAAADRRSNLTGAAARLGRHGLQRDGRCQGARKSKR